MKLDEAFAELSIVQDFIPVGNSNRPQTPLSATFITIHNTDNPDKGANAPAHAKYQKGADARKRKVSWHYSVDDGPVYQSLPTNEVGWHAGTSTGNASSIGIEICMNSDLDAPKAYDRAALLTAVVARQQGIAVPGGIVQHNHWSGKDCPIVLRAKPNAWRDFLKAVEEKYYSLKEVSASIIKSSHTAHDVSSHATAGVPSASDPTNSVAAVPNGNQVAFAEFVGSHQALYWPVITSNEHALVVSHETTNGMFVGRESRRFLANRANGVRYHVGIDIFCDEGDEVIAIADGKIVNFYKFYARPSGEETYALFVAHDGVVCNYGEVKENSAKVYGWEIGDKIVAGQKIARVSGTNMIHFETYVPGTKQNARWMKNASQPTSLLNPSKLLIRLANNSVRLTFGGIATPIPVAVASPVSAVPQTVTASNYDGPLPGSVDWHSKFNGEQWRYDERGAYTRSPTKGERLWRTNGEPVTSREIYRLYGPLILAAAKKHGVNPAIIIMTIATETAFARPEGFTGPKTFRWEAHVENTDISPKFLGSYSAGPMQTLATTARETITLFGKKYGLTYEPFDVAPATKGKPNPAPSKHPMYEPATSIDLGTAEIRRRWSKTGDDPILVAAAYNSGGLYQDDDSSWGLRAHGNHLDRAAEWYGDACSVLSENGIL